MRRFLSITLACALALALAVAAPVGHAQTTGQAYADEANAVCKESARKGRRALEKIKTGNPIEDQVKKSALFAKLLGKTASQLERIEPPPADQQLAESWISSIHKQKRLLQRSVRAFRKGKRGSALQLGKKSAKAGAVSIAKAKQLGATSCGGQGG